MPIPRRVEEPPAMANKCLSVLHHAFVAVGVGVLASAGILIAGCGSEGTREAPEIVTDSLAADPLDPAAGQGTQGPAGDDFGSNREDQDWQELVRRQSQREENFTPLPDEPSHRLSGVLEASDQSHPVDNSFYDEYRLRVPAGAPVRVFLSSEAFDPYLYLFFATPDGELEEDRPPLQNDDWKDDDRSAYLEAEPSENDSIVVVWVNTVSPQETGPYQLRVSTER